MRSILVLLVLLVPGLASANVCDQQTRRIATEISTILHGIDGLYMKGGFSYLHYENIRTDLVGAHDMKYDREIRVAARQPNAAQVCTSIADQAIEEIWAFMDYYTLHILD